MKNAFKHLITRYLELCAGRVIRARSPIVVGITGSVGKTSTTEAIACGLGSKQEIWKSPKSYNSELGLPLTILGLESPYASWVGWARTIASATVRAFRLPRYPRTLVLEMGVDKPGDMARLMQLASPHIAVITAIGDTPVHVENFQNAQALVREKAKILSKQTKDDVAIINYDDEVVRALGEKTKGSVITYGFHKDADVRASEYKLLYEHESAEVPSGIIFKLDYHGSAVPVRLYGAIGKQQVYNALAAAAVGIASSMNLVAISESLRNYDPPPGRLRVIEGLKGSHILDDTYNASPLAVHAALDALREVKKRRSICAIGDMLELGAFAIDAHTEVGEHAANICDELYLVGARSHFIAKGAEGILPPEHIHEYSDATSAGQAIQATVMEGDIILVKGSQSMRMELTVEELMARPEEKGRLLARQEDAWKESQERRNARFLQQSFGSAIVIGGVIITPFTWPVAVMIIAVGVWVYRRASKPYSG